MTATNSLEQFTLGQHLTVPRLWSGLWQLSSNAWGSASASDIREDMSQYTALGLTAFADHYGSSEVLFGQLKRALPTTRLIGATKWCVFRPLSPSQSVVRAAIRERMTRMDTSQIDLLQFHWQNYNDKGYLDALKVLQQMCHEGSISTLGLCNFDSIRTDEICTELGPGAVASNQVQFSIIDVRPLHGMNQICEKHSLKLLTYGTLCGGFLSDRWLNASEPDMYSGNLNPSQRKYLDMILRAWGDWPLFQSLLAVLRGIGDRHGGVSISNVAIRWVLDHSFVGAVIIGARMGLSNHMEDNLKAFGFNLTQEDKDAIEAVLIQSKSRMMITTIGDCGAEYR